MFTLIKQLEANRPQVEAPKLTFIQKVKAIYRSWKGKRAYQALILAKREEKAAAAKTNAELADEMEARSDALINESAMCKRTDPVESDRLFEEAVAMATEASALRFK